MKSLILIVAMGAVGAAQGLPPAQATRPGPVAPLTNPANAATLQGGVAPAPATGTNITLTLNDAIERGLRNNLAALLSASSTEQARAQRMTALAALLPRVDASAGEVRQKINLAAFGFSFPGLSPIVGPFDVFQASAAANVPVLDLSALQSARAARGFEAAAHDDLQSTREMVVLAVANQYLLSVADQSRVTAAQAELTAAETALQQAQDMLKAGTVGALAAVRAQVQRDRQRQLLTAQQNALAKQRLQLARAIGLSPEQEFTLASPLPYAPLTPPELSSAVSQALAARADYRSAQAQARAAQFLVAAARDQQLPTLALNGNYGNIGHEIDSNRPIYSVGITAQLPVFAGGLYKADRIRAEAHLRDANNRVADLRAQIDLQVRSALLDLDSNRSQVQVAQDAKSLADQELTLAQDRFRAGVADNLEVVQAQQSVADADESYIASVYAYNLAKAMLAQALGVAVSGYQQYLPMQ
ncbi:MAG TPA: TolC family protein [Terriglobales bacterium]|nr:TolC family protein [Terriglobales bacterium]